MNGAWCRWATLLTCLGAVLVACRPPEGSPAGFVDRIGVVLLSEAPSGKVSGQATFTRLEAPRAAAQVAAPLGAQVGSCRVTGDVDPSAGPIAPGATGNRLNAGNATFRAGGTDYASLSRTDSGHYQFAGATEPLPATLSFDLAVSGAFPSFTDLSVATGTALRLADTVDPDAITTETEFAWDPGEAGSAVILIGSGGGTAFSCLADDATGTFAFPEATRQELAAAGFAGGKLDVVGRITSTQATSGSSLLMINALRLTDPRNE